MAILRAEALREAAARREEAARKGALASQPGLAQTGTAPAAAEAAPARPQPPAQATPTVRRAALPDIEEINSTLTSGRHPRAAVPVSPSDDPRRGFRAGFGTMMLLAGVAAAAYILAPRIAATVPETSGAMTTYVGTVDHLRRQLDATVATAQRQVESLLHSVE